MKDVKERAAARRWTTSSRSRSASSTRWPSSTATSPSAIRRGAARPSRIAIFRSTVLDDLGASSTTRAARGAGAQPHVGDDPVACWIAGRRGASSMDDYLRLTGQSAEELVAAMRPQAEDAVAQGPGPRGRGRRREHRGHRRDGRGVGPRAGRPQGEEDPDETVERLMADPVDADGAAHRPAAAEGPRHRGRERQGDHARAGRRAREAVDAGEGIRRARPQNLPRSGHPAQPSRPTDRSTT